jgi:hypothetical protein
MKSGKTIAELAAELDRQNNNKRDFLAPTASIHMDDDAHLNVVDDVNRRIVLTDMPMSVLAHDQVAERLSIPREYYHRMREVQPALLARNVNAWMTEKSEVRMVRVLDDRVRAFLSDRYRPLDNYDLAQVVLPILNQVGCSVVSCDVTERHMYLKSVTPRVSGEVKKGDVVNAGVVIQNSEVGCGSLAVSPMIFRLVCTNGMIAGNELRKYHVGGRNQADENDNVYRNATRQARDKAFWMQVQDVVNAAVGQIGFNALLQKLQDAAEQKIERKVVECVEVATKMFDLGEAEGGGVLEYLIKGGDLTKYGLSNAVTRYSQDVDDYERATELEALGGRIIELPQGQWNQIAAA